MLASELGTPQGGCISPLLANIYLDKFDKELEQRELHFVRYADGGCISPLLANIYLDKFDKELEQRELHFVRYADDVVIFVKSDLSATLTMW